jgi:ABC-2 type transport system ATP-binding protein
MDDVEALCSEVTILSTGRVAFSGPIGKLASETSELDYRVRTSDPIAARRLARGTQGLRLRDQDTGQAELLVISASVPALDDFVQRLVRDDVAVRELAPVVSPLEAAFLALTEQQENNR